MANIKQIKIGTTTYDIVDAGAARSSHTHSNYLTSHQDLSNYVTLNTDQTITGKKIFGPIRMSGGRWQNAGDDEGLIIDKASNGYAGVCLGDPGGVRSVFYLNSSDQAVWRYCNVSGGAAYDVSHPGKAGTIALTSDLSRSFSGTTGGNSGTAIAAVTGVTNNGTATALTGVKVSNSSSAAPGGHTHSVTASGTVTLNDGTAPSMNFNTGSSSDNAYISALSKDGYTPAGSVTLTNGTAPSMGAATTRYLHFSAGTTPVNSVEVGMSEANISLNYISGSLSGTTLTLTSNSTKVVGSHFHNANITRGTAPSLTTNTTVTGGIQYVQAQGTFSAGTTPKASASFSGTNSTAVVTGGTTRRMKFSAGTTPKASASFSGTAVTSGANSGANFNAATEVSSNGTATVLTGVKASGTANCAPAGHTHGYSGSTN